MIQSLTIKLLDKTMNDNELKNALGEIRFKAIGANLKLDEISVLSVIFKKSKLKEIEDELTVLSQSMMEVEDAFDENIQIPGAFNGAVMRAAQLSILFSLRSSTRDAIREAKAKAAQIYNDINFYRSLAIALLALVVSIIGIA
jgi:hypothetical protein